MVIRDIPDNFRLAYSKEEIAYRVYKMAGELRSWVSESFEQTDHQVLAVCILRGGVFFFSDLLKEIPLTVEPSFCRTASYSTLDNSAGEVSFIVKPTDMQGRYVLFVDDICDSGRTLKVLQEYALGEGAKSVRTAVLIHRIHEASVFRPDYVGFRHEGPEWFAGYGMDDKNHNTNFPDVFMIGGKVK